MLEILKDGSIWISRGDYVSIRIGLKDKRAHTAYQLKDGEEVYFTVKRSFGDKREIMKKKVDDNGYVVFEGNDTAELPFSKYVYDIKLLSADGKQRALTKPKTFEVGVVV